MSLKQLQKKLKVIEDAGKEMAEEFMDEKTGLAAADMVGDIVISVFVTLVVIGTLASAMPRSGLSLAIQEALNDSEEMAIIGLTLLALGSIVMGAAFIRSMSRSGKND